MGTRNLTIVIQDKKPVVAQYGQWDGYPEGQGTTCLNFLLNCDLNRFKEVLTRCRFIESKQSEQYHKKNPFLTRDNGAGILNLLYEDKTDKLLWIHDNSEFAADSLFCEWAYVIDLDKNTFEVYTGFNYSPLTENDRFYPLQKDNIHFEDQYYPVKHLITFTLDNLPQTAVEFVQKCEQLKTKEEE